MVYLCTFFDIRYLDRGLALHRSLVRQGDPFHLWVLCMDDETRDALLSIGLSDVTLVTTDDLARHDPDVRTAAGNRSLVEFYFTSKSFLCLYIFATDPKVDLLTYLDADAFFFGSPETVRDVMAGSSVGLTPHRFPPHLKQGEQYGRFNAGFLSIRRDEEGLKCLRWWRDSCFAWCHDRVHEGRFADQGYLDRIPELFRRVRIIDHKGINAAPWNISQYRTSRGDGTILIDGDPLVLYHFHGVKQVFGSIYDCGFSEYQDVMKHTVRSLIYQPYLGVLARHQVPARSSDGTRDIRTSGGRFARLRSAMPRLWTLLISILITAKGIRYRSLMTAGSEAERGAD